MNERSTFYVAVLIITVLAFFFLSSKVNQTTVIEVNDVDLFLNMAKKHGTDKVLNHEYQFLYGTIVGPRRNKIMSLLEIGLGCVMDYGPGKSLTLWREYTPNAKVHILEYDAVCAQKFQDKVDKLFIGDQSDFSLLKQISQNNKYDVIIDDGGHTRKQQINSLIGLWPALKPNGIYIIEDMFLTELQNSSYIDFTMSTVKVMEYFTYRLNNVKIPLAIYGSELDQIYSSLLSVNCYKEACVLIKTGT